MERSADYYKWELLRLNQNYQRDYDNYTKAKSKIRKKLKTAITKKYGLFPVNYRIGYDALLKTYQNKNRKRKIDNPKLKELQRLFLRSKNLFLSDSRIKVYEDSYSAKTLKPENLSQMQYRAMPNHDKNGLKGIKTLRIALNLYYSKEKLLSEIALLIDDYKLFMKIGHSVRLSNGEAFKAVYDSHVNKLDLSKTSNDKDFFETCNKPRIPEIKRYLEVYKLKTENNWSWEKLAQKFYKCGVEQEDLNYVKKKIKRDYERCKKLINEGFKHIS